MLTMNRATLVGFAGKNPEMRKLPSGDDVAQFSMATTERFRRKDDTVGEATQWHTIVAYGPAAEVVRTRVRKGDPVLVEGRIATRSWEDKSGNQRRSIEIVVAGRGSVVNVLTKRKAGGNGGGGDPPGGAAPAAAAPAAAADGGQGGSPGEAGTGNGADAEQAVAAAAVPGETAPATAAEVQTGAATEAAVAGDAAMPTAATAGEADATAVGAAPPAAPAPQSPAPSGNDPADHE